MLLIVVGSLVVGRAITRVAGRDRWCGIEPAVGFAAIMAVEGLLARIPGNRWALILGLVALAAFSLWALRRPGRADLPPASPGLWAALAFTAVALAIPFAVTGHWGLLGMGYNNDLGLHLAWAEWLRSGFGTEPSDGYPLGPHGLAAALSFLPKLSLGTIFTGQLMAIVLLTVMTGWSAVERLAGWRRPLAAVLIGLPYLMASYYAQAAFKELAAALFLLAFVISLPGLPAFLADQRSRVRALLPIVVLLAGIVFTYSFPGLAWPVAVAVAWGLTFPGVRATLRPRAIWNRVRRPVVAITTLVVAAILAVLAFLGPFGFGDAFSEVATSDAFGPVSVLEGLGVWLDSDYRLDGTSSTPLPGLLGAISVLALLVSLWWWRKGPRSVWPVAFLACAFLYLISLPWVGEYSLAKALVISAPVTMTVILTALLAGPASGWKPAQGMEFGAWVSLTVLFVAGAVASSFLVLRDASVSPPGHAAELVKFHERIDGKTVLYFDQDRFAPYYLNGAKVSVPLAEFPDPKVIENPKKPFQGDHGQSTIDFDSFDPETLQHHDFAITTSAGWTSMPPPFYREVTRTANYILWRRVNPAFGRPIMREGAMPAKLANCEGEGGKFFSQIEGTAVLMPEAVPVFREDWTPGPDLGGGARTTATVDLEPGTWRVSIQYFSPRAVTLSAPGYERTFPAAIDGQRLANMDTGSNGQFWPGGLLRVKKAGPVELTLSTREPTALQRLTGYSRQTKIGRLVLMRARGREWVPMDQICDRWVDFYRWKSFEDTNRGEKAKDQGQKAGAPGRSNGRQGEAAGSPSGT